MARFYAERKERGVSFIAVPRGIRRCKLLRRLPYLPQDFIKFDVQIKYRKNVEERYKHHEVVFVRDGEKEEVAKSIRADVARNNPYTIEINNPKEHDGKSIEYKFRMPAMGGQDFRLLFSTPIQPNWGFYTLVSIVIAIVFFILGKIT